MNVRKVLMRHLAVGFAIMVGLVACGGSPGTTFRGAGYCLTLPSSVAAWAFTPYSLTTQFDSWDSPDLQGFVHVLEDDRASTLQDIVGDIRQRMTSGEADVQEMAVSLPAGSAWRISGKRPQTGTTLADFAYYAIEARHNYQLWTVGVSPSDADAIARSLVVGECQLSGAGPAAAAGKISDLWVSPEPHKKLVISKTVVELNQVILRDRDSGLPLSPARNALSVGD